LESKPEVMESKTENKIKNSTNLKIKKELEPELPAEFKK
jgi:hypothetical protein